MAKQKASGMTKEEALAVLQSEQQELSQRVASRIDTAIKEIQDSEGVDLEQILVLGNTAVKAPQGSIIWNIVRRQK